MAMISTCSRCGREYEGEDACDHSTPEIEIGACYRDARDGEIVRVLGPEQRLLGFPAVVLKAGESAGHGGQVGARVWRDRDALTERVPDPTPAIVEDSAEGVEPDDLDLEQAADLVRDLRRLRLLRSKVGEGLSPFAEQHYLLALAQLGQAERSLRIASLHEAQWIGARQMGRPFG